MTDDYPAKIDLVIVKSVLETPACWFDHHQIVAKSWHNFHFLTHF